MAEENLTDGEVLESTEEKPEQKVADEKKFTQKELDTHIQQRVKREKDTHASALASWESEKASYDEKLSSYEKVVNDMLTSKKEGLGEDIKTLLDELSIEKQIEYIQKFEAKQEKIKDMPLTPQSKENDQTPEPQKRRSFI